ncbi:beta strand repeat-containing protein [Caballeronia sp. KNU42]
MNAITRNALRKLEHSRQVQAELRDENRHPARPWWSVRAPLRAYRWWQRAVSALVALTLFAGPLSATFEQSRDAAGVLAAGSRRLDDDAWQRIVDLAALRVRFSMQEAQATPIVDPAAPISFQPKITQTTGAGGGVPVVNITAPNAAGISLNQYQSFNIDPVGLILNNSLMSGTSLTGGDLQANPNLSSRTASVIVNQVTSTGAAYASLLNGPLEVFGAPATVIIANPNGITTRGTGFTNTIGVTLSTGTPQFLSDLNGTVSDFSNAQAVGYSVTGGHIQIEGNAGVNGPGAGIEGTVGTIDLIGETIGVNAPLYAGSRINVIAGRQFVLPSSVTDTGTTYATSANGAANTGAAINLANGQANNGLAIDATAYGAITAGQIQVIGTAAGMGVRTDAQLASNAGELLVSANGDISVAGTAAQQQATLQSSGNVSMSGSHIGIGGYAINANGDVASTGTIQSGGKLAVTAGGNVNLANAQSNGDMAIAAGANATLGDVQSGGALAVTAQGNDGAGDINLKGTSVVSAATTLQAARDVNFNGQTNGSTLQATAQRNVNVNAALQSSGDLALTAAQGNIATNSTVKSGGNLALSSGQDTVVAAQATAQNAVTVAAGRDFTVSGSLASGTALTANVARDISVAGSLLVGTNAQVTAGRNLDVPGVVIVQQDGAFSAQGDLTGSGSLAFGQSGSLTTGQDVAFTGKLLANGLRVSAGNNASLADVQAGGAFNVAANGVAGGGDVTFNGNAAVVGATNVQAARDVLVNGTLAGGSQVTLDAQRNVAVASTGTVQAVGDLTIGAATGSANSAGTLNGAANLVVNGAQDVALTGRTSVVGDTTLTAGHDLTIGGTLAGQGGATLNAGHDVIAGGSSGFVKDAAVNAANDLSVTGSLQGAAVSLTAGQSVTLNNVQANAALQVAANGGQVTVNGTVSSLSTGSLTGAGDVAVNGTLQTAGLLGITSGGNTSIAGTVQSNGDVTLLNAAGSLTSTGGIQSGGNLLVNAAQSVDLGTQGTSALGDLTVNAGQNLTMNGSVVAQGNGTLTAGGTIAGAVASAFGLAANVSSGGDTNLTGSLRGGTVQTSAGGSASLQDVQAGSSLALSAANDLNVTGAVTGGAAVTLSAGQNINVSGSIQSAGDTTLTALTGNAGSTGTIASNGAFTVQAGSDVNLGGATTTALDTTLNAARDVNVTGSLAGQGQGIVTAGRDIGGAGTLTFMQAATLDAGRDIAQGGLVQGQSVQAHAANSAAFNNISSAGTINLQADGSVPAGSAGTTPGGDVSIAGNALANGAVTLTAARDATVAGKLSSGATVGIAAQGDIGVSGTVESAGAMNLTAQGNLNATGAVTSGSTLSVTTGLDLNAGGATSSVGSMTLDAGRDAVLNGAIVSEAGATLSASRDLLGSGTQAVVQDLRLSAGRNIGLTGSMQANQVAAIAGNDASLNTVTSGSTLSVAANGQAGGGDAGITGTAAAPGAVNVTAARDVSVSGSLTGGPNVTLSAGRNATIGGAVQSVGDLSVTAQTGDVSVSGSTLSNGATTLSAAQDAAVAGKVGAGTDLNISTQTGNVSIGGSATSNGATTITSAGDANVGGTLASGTTLNMTAQGNIGVAGAMQSTGAMTLAAQGNLDATGGINSGAALNASTGQDLILGASTSAVGALTLNAERDVTLNGVTVGEAGATITAIRDVLGGGTQAFAQDALLTAGRNLELTGSLQANTVNATGGNDATLNNIASATTLTMNANGLAGSGDASITGTASAPGVVTINAARDVSVSGALTGGQTVTLGGQRNATIGGSVQSVGDLSVTAQTGNASIAGSAVTNGALAITSGLDTTIGGQASAVNEMNLQAGGDISVAGTLAGQQNGTLSAAGNVSGAGTMAFAQAANISAGQNVVLSGALQGASIDVTGANNAQLGSAQAITGALNVTAHGQSGGGDVSLLGSGTALGAIALNGARDVNAAGALNSGGATTVQAIRTAAVSDINSTGDLTLSAQTGNVSAANLTTQGNLIVSGGQAMSLASATAGGNATLTSGGNMVLGAVGAQNIGSINAGRNLTASSIASGQQATIGAGGSINVAGAVATNGALNATAGDGLTVGSAQAGTTLALQAKGQSAPGDVTVNGATISGAATSVTAARDANLKGAVTSSGALTVASGRNLNAGSSISSNGSTALSASTGNLNVAGAITSGGNLSATAGGSIGVNSALVNGNTTLNAQGNISASGPLLGLGFASIGAAGQVSVGAITFESDIGVSAGAGISTGAVQTAGQFHANANGDISLGATTAVGDVGVTSNSGNVTFNGAAISGGNLTAVAGNSVYAGAGVSSAGSVSINGVNGNVTVGSVSANGDANLHAGQTLSMNGNTTVVGQVGLSGANVGLTGTISGSKSVNVSATGTLDASGATIIASQNEQFSGTNVTLGNLIAGGSLTANASNQLTLAGSQVAVVGNASLVSQNGFYNASQVLSGGALFVSATNLTNAGGGSLASTSTTTLNASNLTTAGLVNGSATNVTVGGTLSNAGGSLMGLNSLAINTGALNNQNGLIFAGNPNVAGGPTTGDLSLTINGGDGSLANSSGQMLAQRNLAINAGSVSFDPLQQGTISQGGQLSITAAAISVSGTWNYGGQGVSLYGISGVTNTGTITGSSPLTISTQGVFNNSGQLIGSDVTLNGTVSNAAGALLHADNGLTINGDTTNRGTVEAGTTLSVNGGSYDNTGATTQSKGDINFSLGGTLQNTGGSIFAGNNISINAAAVVNDQTAPTGQQTATQTVSDPSFLLSGSIGTLTSSTLAGSLDHAHAVYSTGPADVSALLTSGQAAGGTVTLDQMSDGNWYVDGSSSQAAMQNGGVTQVAQQTFTLPSISETVTTQTPGTSGVISAGNSIQLTAGSLSNRGGQIAASGDISLNIGSLSNGGVSPTVQTAGVESVNAAQYAAFLSALGALGTIALGSTVNPNNDRYVAPTTIAINANSSAPSAPLSSTWSSPTGMIAAGHDMNITGGALVNAGMLYAGNNVNISGASVTNQGGNQQNSSTQTGCASGVPSLECNTGGQTRGGNPTTTTFSYNQNDATIYAGNNLVIAAGQINNTFGNLIAGHDLVVGGVGSTASSTTPAGTLNNTSGNIIAGHDITLNVSGGITNTLPPPVPVHENYGSNEQYSGCMTAGGYKESYCEGYVDQQSGSSSVISAGNNLSISAGSLTNIGSLISAGNTATISVAGPVINEAQTLNAYWHSHWVQETGLFSSDKRNDVWACGSVAECTALYGSAYTGTGGTINPPTPVGNIAATIQAPNLSITSGGQIQNVGNVIGTSVTLTGQKLINGITTANTYTPKVNAPSQVISLSPVDLPGLNLSTPRSIGAALPTAVAGKASYVDNSLGSSAIGAFSPQDLLNNLPPSLQPSSTLFYYNPQEEDVLLQQAALQQTGQASFISGLTYDSKNDLSVTEQEKKILYQNALQYAETNNLQLGDALTQTQINALDEPMLWYVEQTVPDPSCQTVGNATCPMITALMPQVYLPQNTSAMSVGGNIVGQDVTLNFNQGGQGSILNTGTISASGTLTVNTNTLTNQANQVNVGNIWQYIAGAGYSDTTGTVVQPGGFMSAANMDLNVQTLNQVGGALQKLNADGTVDQAGTQQVLAQLQQSLGNNFTQSTVQDNLHTSFTAEGGGVPPVVVMAIAVAVSIVTAGAAAPALGVIVGQMTVAQAIEIAAISAMMGSASSQAFSGNGLNVGQIAEAGAVAAITAGLTNGITYDSSSGFGVSGLGDQVSSNSLGSLAGINTAASKLGGTVTTAGSVAASNLPEQALAIAGTSAISAGVQTAIEGGSFLNSFKSDLVGGAAAAGAFAIGGEFGSTGSDPNLIASIASHAVLGCASSAALGSGCAGGAIGGATSAVISPYIISQIDPTGAPPTPEQAALVTAIAMLAGGGIAGALGQNVTGAATAAENQVENNDLKHILVALGFLTPLAPGNVVDDVSYGLTLPADTLQEELKENVIAPVVLDPFTQGPPKK